MDEIRVYVKGGYLRANRNDDPDYPGIDVEFVPDNYDGTFTIPRVLFEQPTDRNDIQCRALVWENKNEEDFTTEIEWKREKRTNMKPEDIKTITCKEYLKIFNINNVECTTLDDLWDYTHMFTPMGNLIQDEENEESISAEYWDFSEKDFFGGAIEPNEDRDYVRIENRIFEIPKMD